MRPTTSRALIAAGVVALTFGALSIPDLRPLVLVLFISMWLLRVAGWTPRKQPILTWLVAACVGAFIVLISFWVDAFAAMNEPNKITGANAGSRHQPPVRKSWAARIAQFFRSL